LIWDFPLLSGEPPHTRRELLLPHQPAGLEWTARSNDLGGTTHQGAKWQEAGLLVLRVRLRPHHVVRVIWLSVN
jgi:hypothetical protein